VRLRIELGLAAEAAGDYQRRQRAPGARSDAQGDSHSGLVVLQVKVGDDGRELGCPVAERGEQAIAVIPFDDVITPILEQQGQRETPDTIVVDGSDKRTRGQKDSPGS
jgi:hypothetical protein